MCDDPDALIISEARSTDELPEGVYGLFVALLLLEDRSPDMEVRRGLEARPRLADHG